MIYYGVAWGISLYVLWSKDYFWDYREILNEHARIYLYDVPNDVMFIYSMQLGWYILSLFTHFLLDSKKSDDALMVAHHVLTILLIYLSYTAGYTDFGVLVLFSMDICDVFLEFVRALRLYGTASDIIEIFIFLPLPISWVLFRIIFYYRSILRYTLFYSVVKLGWPCTHMYFVFNPMLLTLLAMNLYWFYLIMRIGVKKVLHGQVLDDARESNPVNINEEKEKKKSKTQ
jgi:hypothetical protein